MDHFLRPESSIRMLRTLAFAAAVLAASSGRTEDTMKISSPSFANGAPIPKRFTADGANINPALTISGVPPAAASLVLIVDDPDAPGGTWTHWLVWNIAPATTRIAEDSVPDGAVVGRSDFGKSLYLGPSPPSGTHRYHFRLYALDKKLDLAPGANRDDLDTAMRGRILASATWAGTYSRK